MTKKSVLTILSIIITVILTGCAMLDLGKITSSNDPETESEKAVARLHEDIRSSSVGEFDDYFTPDDDAMAMYGRLTDKNALKNSFDRVFINMSNYLTEERTEEVLASYTSRVYGVSDYTIDRVLTEGDETEVLVTVKMPDFDKLKTLNDIDIMPIIDEKFEFDIKNEDLLLAEIALRKGKDEAELRKLYKESPDSVWITDILELFTDEINASFGQIMDEILLDCPMKEYKIQYTVEKQMDDTWKITDVDND